LAERYLASIFLMASTHDGRRIGRRDWEVIMTGKVTTYFVAGVLSVACSASAQSDLDEYVSSIRQSGMSESAAGSVRMVASILSGSSTFRAIPTPDGWGLSYGPPENPNLRWEEKFKTLRTREANREAWTEFLKDYADTDGSGFVSTEEGRVLRRLVETALVAAQLRPASTEELYNVVPEASKVEADLAAYAAMRTEAAKQGLEGIPALPEGLDTTPR
jgi:hypothetical protein